VHPVALARTTTSLEGPLSPSLPTARTRTKYLPSGTPETPNEGTGATSELAILLSPLALPASIR
jgi:hypothetical protein